MRATDDAVPAGRFGEGAVDEDDGGLGGVLTTQGSNARRDANSPTRQENVSDRPYPAAVSVRWWERALTS